MKQCLNDSNNNGSETTTSNNNNWLGFSLSPHMKMEVTNSDSHFPPPHPHHQNRPPQSISTITDHFNSASSNPFCFIPSIGENSAAAFHPPLLSVMPIKSDGSLCILEALRRSQAQGSFAFSLFISSSSLPFNSLNMFIYLVFLM